MHNRAHKWLATWLHVNKVEIKGLLGSLISNAVGTFVALSQKRSTKSIGFLYTTVLFN